VVRYLTLAFAAGALVVTSGIAWWKQDSGPQPNRLVPTLTGKPEYCVTCHPDLPEISASHPVATFGCVSCHGGEPLALDAELAHSTMRGGSNPSDPTVVEASCGGSQCHSGSAADQQNHIQRVMTSVQSTYAGAIANILFTFGAEPDLVARYGMQSVGDDVITTSTGLPSLQQFDPAAYQSPTISKFAANCTSCHLGAEPPVGAAYARFTGCAACHTPLDPGAGQGNNVHALTTAIPYTQCNTCHNRGNFNLRSMEFVERSDTPHDRLHDYYQPIAQSTLCEYTLDCIDCHTRIETMGDGDIHSNKKDIQYIACKTCHGTPTQLPDTAKLSDPNNVAFRQAQLNPVVDLAPGQTVLATEAGEPLWNTRVLPNGTYELIGKTTGERFVFRPVMGSGCTQDPAEQASQYCHECHAVTR
jgi:hypothetical protein